MIHFIISWSKDPSQSPLAQALRELGVPHRLIAGEVLLRYRHRIWLLLVGLPRLLRFALHSAWRSLVQERPHPDAVVVGSHLEALVFALSLRLLRRRTRVYLLGFIFTRRANAWLDRLRRAFFGALFDRLDGVLCHSRLEARRYEALFPTAAGKFVFVPYGLHIAGAEQSHTSLASRPGVALSAGRSGRDYELLTRVFASLGRPLRIVCDSSQALARCVQAPNIEVLRHCYDADYVRELRQASMVIVPLSVDDIPAGQMVAIQAMAFGKPLIITDTPTVRDYLCDGEQALLIEADNGESLRSAVLRLDDEALRLRLSERARETYLQRHSMRAFVTHIVTVVAGGQQSATET